MISIIAAIGKNGELGKNNDLIWHLPGDLKFFKETTLNHPVIMGYNTYLSIGKPLPKRKNIVIAKDVYEIDADITLYNDIDELISKEIKAKEDEIFIIGGASMYNYFYPIADKMYLTLVDAEDKEADTYFPKSDESKWKKTLIKENEDNGIKYRHVLYERLNNE
ncbi:MAG: dihydrofolate reductase [Bacilli bacterium]|nr:dihydrofolate reductase [Bacilli bacterium]